ncbi:Uncharacterized protein PECH_008125 [Penicillium ucsense]|uniref:Uncharacterized protein n=1 Tax=Penicillium ucsense TaxID=2839758 RepID=A0A8J8WAY8_9EURO|nr:Uncharacterized protein PECM_003322 [Penicillium ucsense]KAF7738754.1 Uncharacterized protein PECH_008125 [Penicillium ucsense]
MLRLFNRFYTLCALAVCTILYSAWVLTSRTLRTAQPFAGLQFRTAPSFDRRLVVFGDSWSDRKTVEGQGRVWTDWLCEQFSCHQENLAQSAKSSWKDKLTGSVVDNADLEQVARPSATPLPDFKSQVQLWLDAESETVAGLTEDQIRSRQDRTVFAVSFGLWDIWNLLTVDYNVAEGAVQRRVTTLMAQLSRLAETWGSRPESGSGSGSNKLKVILTQTVDVTFVPGFAMATGVDYKDAVRILEVWNKKLRQAAQTWDRGTIYLFDTNAFVLDRIRDWQLYAAGIEEQNGLGTNRDPGWENVVDPCVESESRIQALLPKGMSPSRRQCTNPEKYLFWDEMHLGPSAHRLMATAIYQGIDGVLLNPADPK